MISTKAEKSIQIQIIRYTNTNADWRGIECEWIECESVAAAIKVIEDYEKAAMGGTLYSEEDEEPDP